MSKFFPSCAALVLSVVATPAHAQKTGPSAVQQAVYFEFLGNGGFYSINYERALHPMVRVRAGVAAWSAESLLGWGDEKTNFVTFPIMVQIVPGGGVHHPELGIGVLLGQQSQYGSSEKFVSVSGLIGYRYEPPRRRLVVRAGLTPFYGFGEPGAAYPDSGFLPSLGFSVGRRL